MKNTINLLSTLILCFVFNNAYADQASMDDEAAVRQAMDQLFATYNSGDLAGHIALFSHDSIELPPNQPLVTGRDNIHQRKISSMQRADAVLNARIDELIVSGDWAIVRMTGTGKITLRDGTVIDPNDKAILIWNRQDDNSWKLTHDIWNSNLPVSER
jgi:uncharacterized protein (TIGR02246 family)